MGARGAGIVGVSMKQAFRVPADALAVTLAGVWVTLPMPPTVNHYYDPSARGLCVKRISGHGIRFRKTVYYELRRLTKAPIRQVPPRLRVEVELSFETKAKNDLDNRMKALLDALRVANMIADDSEIDELVIRRGPIIKDKAFFGGQCRVKVETIPNIVVTMLTGPHPPQGEKA